jgi:hypothetical protein
MSRHKSLSSPPNLILMGNSFDVGGFSPLELGMNSSSSSNEADHEPESVKYEH